MRNLLLFALADVVTTLVRFCSRGPNLSGNGQLTSITFLILCHRQRIAYLERHEASLAFLDSPPGDCALPLIASCDPSLREEVHEFIRSKIEHDLASRR
jgi:hypothetical protein